jgi:hypothetical protein
MATRIIATGKEIKPARNPRRRLLFMVEFRFNELVILKISVELQHFAGVGL